MKSIHLLGFVVCLFVEQAQAAPYTFTLFDVPGVDLNCSPVECQLATGINDNGVIIGRFVDLAGKNRGFVRDTGGSFTILDEPYLQSINDAGQIVGNFTFYSGGFTRDVNGSISPLLGPGSAVTYLAGINDAGHILGATDSPAIGGAFLRYSDGSFSELDFSALGFPADTYVALTGINDVGEIMFDAVGSGVGGSFVRDSNGVFSSFYFDGLYYTSDINDSGTIIGSYDGIHGFARDRDGRLTILEIPGGFYTRPFAINDAGHIVGYFYDGSSHHVFLATPVPVPAALVLLCSALGALGVARSLSDLG